MKYYLILFIFLNLETKMMAQKNKKLENLSGFVNEIAVKKKNGEYFKSGTALFVMHKGEYYAVTAKHCFMDSSTQAKKTIPTIINTLEEACFFSELDAFGKVKLLHREALHNGHHPLFKIYTISDLQAIDVAALKLINPSDEVKGLSIDSDCFDNSGNINYLDDLVITGFPSYFENKVDSLITGFVSKEIQEMLDDDHKYYFMMPTYTELRVKSMSGFSGSAILAKNRNKIVGFVAGENKATNLLYGIYAKYMTECLNSFSN